MTAEGFDWVAQIDTDEFILINDPRLPYCIGEFLRRFDDSMSPTPTVGGVVFRWRVMVCLCFMFHDLCLCFKVGFFVHIVVYFILIITQTSYGVFQNEKNKLLMEENLYMARDNHAHVKVRIF
jgi:hypothetical protein